MRFILGVLAGTFVFMSVDAAAETGYVTDRLILGLHQAPDTSDRAFRSLESGQEFEVLSRDRLYAHVQLPDGTQGYVKAAYIVYEKPAKLIVSQTQAEVERLSGELNSARAAFAEPAATIDRLESEVESRQSELDASLARIEELEAENSSFRKRAERYQYSLPVNWVGGAIALCLILGFVSGLWWVDHRSRKRHGGIRIY
jgi:SH3 domain protein